MDKLTSISIVSKEETQSLSQSRRNLFFIKSKHAFKQFKNHDYFETKTTHISAKKDIQAKEFVSSPAPFGINNAYQYVCHEISRNLLTKSTYPVQTEIDHERIKTGHKKIGTAHSVRPFRPRNRSSIEDPIRQTSYLLPNVSSKSKRVQTLSQNFNQKPVVAQRPKTQQLRCFVLVGHTGSRFKTSQLRLNIYPYVVNTFLKCRLSYEDMSQLQFEQIKEYMIRIYGGEKEYVEYKDMVNMRTMKELFGELESQKRDQVYKREMIRYFFIAQHKAYQYQLECMKDQIKRIIGQQFKRDIGHEELYLADQEGNPIQDLFQLLNNPHKCFMSTDIRILEQYRGYLHDKEIQTKLAMRIKKWKSIAPQPQLSENRQQMMTVPSQRYQTLFRSIEKRREKWNYRKRQTRVSYKSFIDKNKLNKGDYIFE